MFLSGKKREKTEDPCLNTFMSLSLMPPSRPDCRWSVGVGLHVGYLSILVPKGNQTSCFVFLLINE